jgi:hypothetical protein
MLNIQVLLYSVTLKLQANLQNVMQTAGTPNTRVYISQYIEDR